MNLTSEQLAGTTEQELLFTIIEGPRYKLSSVEIVGNDFFSTLELRALVQPEKDGYFSRSAFLDGAKRIWEHYGQVGRLTTVVRRRWRRSRGRPAAVRYVIAEGRPSRSRRSRWNGRTSASRRNGWSGANWSASCPRAWR